MVRLEKEDAERLLRGKTPREVYEIVRDRVSKAPGASINDFFDTLDWVVKEGYATEAEFRSGAFSSAISRTWACVTFPTLVRLGTPDPFASPAARLSSTDAGGVLVMKVN